MYAVDYEHKRIAEEGRARQAIHKLGAHGEGGVRGGHRLMWHKRLAPASQSGEVMQAPV